MIDDTVTEWTGVRDSGAPLRAQKITMLIQVLPSPRLNIVRECREAERGIVDVGRPIDDGLCRKAANGAASDIEILASSLAFDVALEDLFLLRGEAVESLLSGVQKTVTVVFPPSGLDALGDNDRAAEQQTYPKIQLTFIPQVKEPQRAHDGCGQEKCKPGNGAEADGVCKRLLQYLQKQLHDIAKHKRRFSKGGTVSRIQKASGLL